MKKMFAVVVLSVLCLGTMAHAQFAATGTTTLNLTVGPEAAIQINTATTNLTTSTTTFANPFTGTTNFSYKVRTTKVGGSGSITSQVTSDFTAGGGGNPSVAAPPAGDTLSYTCNLTGVGSACSGSQTASTSSATSVATFGANAHSSAAGDSGSVAWSLTNDPGYPTGSYNATVTFTIAAL